MQRESLCWRPGSHVRRRGNRTTVCRLCRQFFRGYGDLLPMPRIEQRYDRSCCHGPCNLHLGCTFSGTLVPQVRFHSFGDRSLLPAPRAFWGLFLRSFPRAARYSHSPNKSHDAARVPNQLKGKYVCPKQLLYHGNGAAHSAKQTTNRKSHRKSHPENPRGGSGKGP